jgi:hypothetical protein
MQEQGIAVEAQEHIPWDCSTIAEYKATADINTIAKRRSLKTGRRLSVNGASGFGLSPNDNEVTALLVETSSVEDAVVELERASWFATKEKVWTPPCDNRYRRGIEVVGYLEPVRLVVNVADHRVHCLSNLDSDLGLILLSERPRFRGTNQLEAGSSQADYKRMNGSASETMTPPITIALPASGLPPLPISKDPSPMFMASGTRITRKRDGPRKNWENQAPRSRPAKPSSKGPATPTVKTEALDSGNLSITWSK